MPIRILTNCNIYTFNTNQPTANAIALQDKNILAVGSQDEITSMAGKDTVVEDLHGNFMIPALTDAHIHLLEYGFSLTRVDCETATREECLRHVQQRAAQTPPGKWILGHGWNHNIWPQGSGNMHMLDAISKDCPIYLTHKSLHSGWANSTALALAGITEESSDPDSGQFQRDAQGHLTGILLESAMRVMENAIPQPEQSERIEALQLAQQRLFEYGIASVHDFDIWDCCTALQAMESKEQLKLRVMKSIPLPELDNAIQAGLTSGSGSEQLTISWLKLFADGALGPQTAAMLDAFEGSNSTGMLFLTSRDVEEIGRKALSKGISLAIHAIGDRANREVINGYAHLTEAHLLSRAALPVRIEHVQLITDQDIERMAALGIIASMQPIHAPSDHLMADKYWGDRCRNAYAWQLVKSGGVDLIFSSDAPVESPNPYWGLYAALTRRSPITDDGLDSWHPDLCLDRTDAFSAYITQPQAAAGKSSILGKIQSGYRADLVVLPEDPFEITENGLVDLSPCATMVNGEWVFKKDAE